MKPTYAVLGKLFLMVAPHAGAWIETLSFATLVKILEGSHPTRVRGLKQVQQYDGRPAFYGSHPTRVRGLKLSAWHGYTPRRPSHPTRVRGLKPR